MGKLEVKIIKISKHHYRIVESKKDGIGLGKVIDGCAYFLEFRNKFSAKSYIENDKRLILISE